jgi:lipopolysaccharide export system permease protein
MVPPNRLPISVISRYLISEFWNMFRLTLGGFVIIYMVVDFFDRLGFFLGNNASPWAAARYLLFKLPLIVTQVTPPAVLASTLLSLALIGRRNELVALRASGVSLYRIARPLLLIAAAISLAILVWNETIVPASTHASEDVALVDIRHQAPRTILSGKEIWYHGSDGFYNIDHIDRERQTLYGIVIYRLSDTFQVLSTIAVQSAHWDGRHWEIKGAMERRLTPSGDVEFHPVPPGSILQKEKMADFLEVYRDPDELSYRMLSERIRALTRKGIDASSYRVDLDLKLAVPFMSLVLAALGIPIAGRVKRNASVAATIGVGTLVGFSYWVILALGMSLGHGGALPPLVAAWGANVICTLIATGMFLTVE